MYPFSVKFKIGIERISEEMTVENLIEYFKDNLKNENVEFTEKSDNKIEFSSSVRFRLFNLMTMFDKGYIKVEKIGNENFNIIHRISLLPIMALNILFLLILLLATKQLFLIYISMVFYLISSIAMIGKQYSFFSNCVDRYLESGKNNNQPY